MKRVVLAGIVALASGAILAACLPPLPGPAKSKPSSPTPLPVPLASPEAATATISALFIEASPTPVPTDTFTPIPSFTSTVVSTGTGTEAPLLVNVILVTDTATPAGSVSVDKLPPNTIYKPVRIQNRSGAKVDISLQCTTRKGLQTFLEYNNVRNVSSRLPEGNYVYVVYAGGRQMVGGFPFLAAPKLVITVYRDRVVIQ